MNQRVLAYVCGILFVVMWQFVHAADTSASASISAEVVSIGRLERPVFAPTLEGAGAIEAFNHFSSLSMREGQAQITASREEVVSDLNLVDQRIKHTEEFKKGVQKHIDALTRAGPLTDAEDTDLTSFLLMYKDVYISLVLNEALLAQLTPYSETQIAARMVPFKVKDTLEFTNKVLRFLEEGRDLSMLDMEAIRRESETNTKAGMAELLISKLTPVQVKVQRLIGLVSFEGGPLTPEEKINVLDTLRDAKGVATEYLSKKDLIINKLKELQGEHSQADLKVYVAVFNRGATPEAVSGMGELVLEGGDGRVAMRVPVVASAIAGVSEKASNLSDMLNALKALKRLGAAKRDDDGTDEEGNEKGVGEPSSGGSIEALIVPPGKMRLIGFETRGVTEKMRNEMFKPDMFLSSRLSTLGGVESFVGGKARVSLIPFK